MFAHRRILNFGSILDEQNTIALPSQVLMQVLYAHTRVELILDFCLNPSFNLFDEFSRYFNLYWAWRLIQPNIDSLDVQPVGHPSGHLQQLIFLGQNSGGSTTAQTLLLTNLWTSSQDWIGMDIYPMQDFKPAKSTLCSVPNWSTVDIDSPHLQCQSCYPQPFCICADPLMQISD